MFLEADNTRKRCERETAIHQKVAISDFAKSLIPVSDSLSRALESSSLIIKKFEEENHPLFESYTSLREGIVMTNSSLDDAYRDNGVTKVGCVINVYRWPDSRGFMRDPVGFARGIKF